MPLVGGALQGRRLETRRRPQQRADSDSEAAAEQLRGAWHCSVTVTVPVTVIVPPGPDRGPGSGSHSYCDGGCDLEHDCPSTPGGTSPAGPSSNTARALPT